MNIAGSGGQVRHNQLYFEYVYILIFNDAKIYVVGHTSKLQERIYKYEKEINMNCHNRTK
jgi:hypothetical protein